ncbi:uncharacterized protein LOC118664294 isoform X2 [Myotis myotis]|uniref:uncharacterized protein LOC118664294 isoform X2 n=1 Tax=Myotis myotis TaxID=51298 RepID=UPI00174DB1DE|nr:uncharacterized protein LOC118664294 isoform X2 [Myotis myotis]
MTLLIQIPQSTAELGGDRPHGAVFPREGLHLHTSLKCPFQVTSRPDSLMGGDTGRSRTKVHSLTPPPTGSTRRDKEQDPSAHSAPPLLPQLGRRGPGPHPREPRAVAVPCQVTAAATSPGLSGSGGRSSGAPRSAPVPLQNSHLQAAWHGPSQRPLPSAALPRAGSQTATLLRRRSRLHHQDIPRSLRVYFCYRHPACGDFSATSVSLEPGRNAHGAPVKGPAAARRRLLEERATAQLLSSSTRPKKPGWGTLYAFQGAAGVPNR